MAITLTFPSRIGKDKHAFNSADAQDMAWLEGIIKRFRMGDPARNVPPHHQLDGAKVQFVRPDPDDPNKMKVVLEKKTSVVQMLAGSSSLSHDYRLSEQFARPGKGQAFEESQAAYFPAVPKDHPGWAWRLSKFDWANRKARITLMSPEQVNARRIMAAAIGHEKDPWSITVAPGAPEEIEGKKEHGWVMKCDFTLSSDMQQTVDQAAADLGAPGWYCDIDPKAATITVHPGTLPSFKPVHPYPFKELGDPKDYWKTPAGVLLPKRGGDPYKELYVNWKASNFLLVGGEPGSGKSVFINTILASCIAQDLDLAIIDVPNKATDYYWCRPWVKPGYWGCGSAVQAMGVLTRIAHDLTPQGGRGQAWIENGWRNWKDIPEWGKKKYPQLLVVVDEYATLISGAKAVTHLPNPDKTFPSAFKVVVDTLVKYHIREAIRTIVNTGRAQGVRLILISQTINQQSGLGPVMRDQFGHRVAMGPRPSQSLLNGVIKDPKHMQPLPESAASGPASKGVARYESDDMSCHVFKSHWAGHDHMGDTEALARALVKVRPVPKGVDEKKFLALFVPRADGTRDVATDQALTRRIEINEGVAWGEDPEVEEAHMEYVQCQQSHEQGPSDEDKDKAAEAGKTAVSHQPKLKPASDKNLVSAQALKEAMQG